MSSERYGDNHKKDQEHFNLISYAPSSGIGFYESSSGIYQFDIITGEDRLLHQGISELTLNREFDQVEAGITFRRRRQLTKFALREFIRDKKNMYFYILIKNELNPQLREKIVEYLSSLANLNRIHISENREISFSTKLIPIFKEVGDSLSIYLTLVEAYKFHSHAILKVMVEEIPDITFSKQVLNHIFPLALSRDIETFLDMLNYILEEYGEGLPSEISSKLVEELITHRSIVKKQYGLDKKIYEILLNHFEIYPQNIQDMENIIKSGELERISASFNVKHDISRWSSKLGLNSTRIMNWLSNFELREQWVARKIIHNIILIDQVRFSILCKKLYRRVLDGLPFQDQNFYFVSLRFTPRSEKSFSYWFRRSGNLPRNRFRSKSGRNLLNLTDKTIIFLDDFAVSGKSFITYFNKYKHHLEKNYCVYAPLFTTKEAVEKVAAMGTVHVSYLTNNLLTERHFPLHPTAGLFKGEDRREALEILNKYGKKIFPRAPLGGDDLGLLIVFYYGASDKTLPIIWGQSKTWNPLFSSYSDVENGF